MFKKLLILIITAFVDMVGLLMVLPLMPYYARTLGASALMVTLLIGSFTAAQLVSAPMWGRFSDRYGRRPALLVGLGAAAIAYVVFAFANSIWLLLLSRVVQGAGGGTVGVIQAYVADATEPNARAKALGWLSAATNVGVALGPPLGSLALLAGRSGPGLAAAALCLINMVFAWKYLHESRDMVDARHSLRKRGASRAALAHVLTHAKERGPRLIWIYAIAMGAFAGMNAILALYLADRFGVGERRIWIFLHLHRNDLRDQPRRNTRLGGRSLWRSPALTHRPGAARDGADGVSFRSKLCAARDSDCVHSAWYCFHVSVCDVTSVACHSQQ